MRLRPLHRHGLLPQFRRREPAHLQPQLPGPQRHRRTRRSTWCPRKRPWPPPSPATITDPHARSASHAGRHAAGAIPASNDSAVLPPAPADEADGRWRCCAAPTSSPSRKSKPFADSADGEAGAQGGRQHHHRPHHAGRGEDPALSLEHPVAERSSASTVCDPDLSGARQSGRETASSSAAATTGRAPPGSTRRWCPCIWASGASWPRASRRIHAANLINAGILPLTFENPEDYDKLQPGRCSDAFRTLPAAWSRGDSTVTD